MGALGNRTLSDELIFSDDSASISEKKSTQIAQSDVAERTLYMFNFLLISDEL
jgi:hypothetical protein